MRKTQFMLSCDFPIAISFSSRHLLLLQKQIGIYFGISHHVGNEAVFVGLMGCVLHPRPHCGRVVVLTKYCSDSSSTYSLRSCFDIINASDGFLKGCNNGGIMRCWRRRLSFLNGRDLYGHIKSVFRSRRQSPLLHEVRGTDDIEAGPCCPYKRHRLREWC